MPIDLPPQSLSRVLPPHFKRNRFHGGFPACIVLGGPTRFPPPPSLFLWILNRWSVKSRFTFWSGRATPPRSSLLCCQYSFSRGLSQLVSFSSGHHRWFWRYPLFFNTLPPLWNLHRSRFTPSVARVSGSCFSPFFALLIPPPMLVPMHK